MDGIALPIAIIVLISIIKSLRLMLIPLACIVVSSLVTFLVLYPIALVFEISKLAFSIS